MPTALLRCDSVGIYGHTLGSLATIRLHKPCTGRERLLRGELGKDLESFAQCLGIPLRKCIGPAKDVLVFAADRAAQTETTNFVQVAVRDVLLGHFSEGFELPEGGGVSLDFGRRSVVENSEVDDRLR